jgi:hypothetical protein
MAADQAGQSYPSGHASIGWAWALVLADLAPDRAEAILARGRAFGESRAVCGVHFPSDIAAGQDIGGHVVTRLYAEPAFRADLERARGAVGLAGPVTEACQAEAALSSAEAVPAGPTLVPDRGQPQWVGRPSASDFRRAYPKPALKQRLSGGSR